MIVGIYQAEINQSRVYFPIEARTNPLNLKIMSNWDIKVINAADIDHQKWSKMLSMTPELIAQFHEHWFLSAIAENWSAYVYGDYLSAFVCVYKK